MPASFLGARRTPAAGAAYELARRSYRSAGPTVARRNGLWAGCTREHTNRTASAAAGLSISLGALEQHACRADFARTSVFRGTRTLGEDVPELRADLVSTAVTQSASACLPPNASVLHNHRQQPQTQRELAAFFAHCANAAGILPGAGSRERAVARDRRHLATPCICIHFTSASQ